jgi:hypothetical protein
MDSVYRSHRELVGEYRNVGFLETYSHVCPGQSWSLDTTRECAIYLDIERTVAVALIIISVALLIFFQALSCGVENGENRGLCK